MRPVVFTRTIAHRLSQGGHMGHTAAARGLSLQACLLVLAVGCQTTQPWTPGTSSSNLRPVVDNTPPPSPAARTTPAWENDSTPLPTSDKSPAGPVGENSNSPLNPAAARIRGQSPSQWNSAPPGSQAYQTPMVPTNTMAPTNTMVPSNTMLYNPYPNSGPIPNGAGVGGYATDGYGYSTPGAYASPSDYGAAVAPGVTQLPNTLPTTLAPGAYAGVDPSGIPFPDITSPGGMGYQPRQRISPIDVYVQEARTGRIILGGSVNSDLGVAGQLVIDERNFDIRSVPHSWSEMWSGRAFRGGGQNFRAELMPGNQVQRYTVNWTERNLFGYLPYSLSIGGFYFTRMFRDWTEQRLGGRAALGYEVTKDLSISGELRLEDVNMSNPRVAGVEELDSALGSNDVYTARFRVARDTRDSPFMSTEGALLELIFDQVFGEYDFSRGNVNYSRYFLMRERADGGGRHTLASTWRFGVTGSQTPIFENFYAGGYSTLRGFSFRGASPTVNNVQVGGELMFLGSLEYLFPLTADEMLRGVAFVDYGTVEQDLTISSENFRVAPGLGLRVSVPALGPAPLAFDFAYPINHADTDDRQVFSFFMGFTR